MKATRPRRGDDNLFNDDWVVAEPDPGIVPKPSRLPAAGRFRRRKGRKCYELKNHLGNVLTVISDRKLGIADPQDSTVALYYEAEVLSLSDYYPFGMQQPGRSYSAGVYRYGFNGMEADDEIKGTRNSYTTQWRQYDSRINRWLSVDPLASKAPGWTSYRFGFNNPISNIDPTGLFESTHIDENGNVIAEYDDGDDGVYVHKNGTTVQSIEDYRNNCDNVCDATNTDGGGYYIGDLGGSLDIGSSGVYFNKLSLSANETLNKNFKFGDWFNNVKGGGKWDLKANKETIGG